jgi:hypothetical protein
VVPGTIVAERFRIVGVAAAGGMGTVYRAHDLHAGRPVAVKVMRAGGAGDVDRFHREIRVLAGLRHPAIVEYVASGVGPDGAPFLASEWVDGESLAQRLAREGLTAAESVRQASAAAAALGFAHRHGVVHRDVKPDNLLFAGGDLARLKVIDFGIARVGEAAGDARLTRTGALLGTPGYMSPEQARGDRAIDARTDVFALGCVLYECLTGRCAFSGSNLLALRTKIVFSEPPPLEELAPEIPPRLARPVAAMLSKDPAGRPADGDAVAEALAGVGPLPDTRRRPVRPPQPPTHVAHPAAAGGGACLVLAATARGSEATRPTELARREDELRRAVAPFGARLECLADGVVAIRVGEDPVRGARCALAVRALLPDAAIVLCQSPTAVRPLDDAIDRGGLALEELAMRALFAEAVPRAHEPGGIRVDGSIAGRLDAGFHVTRAAGGFVLHGERPAR